MSYSRKVLKVFTSLTLSLYCLSGFPGVTNWLDIELENGLLRVPVVLNGVEGTALLDTGAKSHGINKYFAEEHKSELIKGRKFIVSGVHSTEKLTSYNNVSINLFGADFKVDNVLPINTGTSLFLLGSAFFDKFIFQIDYPNSRMRLFTRDAVNLRKLQNVKMNAANAGNWPIVILNIEGRKKVRLIMDTGSNGGLYLDRDIAKNLGWLDKYELRKIESTGINSKEWDETFYLSKLKFGPFTLENVQISVPDEGRGFNIDMSRFPTSTRFNLKSVDGLLGYDVLKHFVLTLDYKKGYMHVGLPE